MRTILVAALLATLSTGAFAIEPVLDGPVAGGAFGMSGADYHGDTRSRMPFTREAPPPPVGIGDVARAQAARRAEIRRSAVGRRTARRKTARTT